MVKQRWAGEVEDEFICFTIDPGLSEAQWLEAFQVIPDDLAVVHHVLVGIDHEGTSADLANSDGRAILLGLAAQVLA